MHRLTPAQFKKLRKKLKITQVTLAKWFGLSPQSVARWEKGQARVSGSAAVLAWWLYDQEINGNPNTVSDYVRAILSSQSEGKSNG